MLNGLEAEHGLRAGNFDMQRPAFAAHGYDPREREGVSTVNLNHPLAR